MSTILQTEHLSFTYPAEEEQEVPTAALEDVTLSIEEGSFVVVLGHNGSGKSTLAKHMNAVLLPGGGAVYVAGMDTRNEALDADRLIVMNDGRLTMDGAPAEVFAQVETLRGMGLAAPDTVELLYALRQSGMDVPLTALTVDDCAAAICKALQ